MNSWQVYSFLKMVSGVNYRRDKEAMMKEFEQILDMPTSEVREGFIQFSLSLIGDLKEKNRGA